MHSDYASVRTEVEDEPVTVNGNVTLENQPRILFQAMNGYVAKMKKFEPCWKNNYEKKALNLIEKFTGLKWRQSARVVRVVARHPNDYEKIFSALTDIPRRPEHILLFDMKNNESVTRDLIHELIHSIIWSNYLNDQRVRPIGLFDDIFADELLAELISQKIYIRMGLNKKMNYQEALMYGFETALEKIADILGIKANTWRLGIDKRKSSTAAKNLRKVMMHELKEWFRIYIRNVQIGTTNALRGVKEIANLFSNISENQ